MTKSSYTLPPPPVHIRDRAAHFLKLLPIAALLAAGASQAWADEHCAALGGGCAGDGGSSNNTGVIVDTDHGSSSVYGGHSKADDVTLNHLTIKAGGKAAHARGGYTSGTGKNATQNTLTVEGGTVTVGALGGESQNGNATGNKVFITGGTVNGATGGNSYNFDATGNEVTIDGGEVTQSVMGGWSYGGNATDNRVILKSDVPTANVSGGYCSGASCDDVAGNTLEVHGSRKVKSIGAFAAIEFNLPVGFSASDTALISERDVNLSNVAITVKGSIPALTAGQTLKLINKTTGKPASITGLPSGYEFDADGGELVIKIPATHAITATATPDGAGTVNCDPNPVPEGATVTCSVTFNGDYNKVGDLTGLQASLPAGVTCKPLGTTAVECSGITNDLTVEIPLIKDSSGSEGGESGSGSTGGSGTGTGGDNGSTPGGNAPGGSDDAGTGNGTGFTGGGDSSSPTMGEFGLLLSSLALAGAAAPALRRRERKGRQQA